MYAGSHSWLFPVKISLTNKKQLVRHKLPVLGNSHGYFETATETRHEMVQDDWITGFRDYQLLFSSQRSETIEPVTLRITQGSIPPKFPSGTYYLAGPGLFSDDNGSTVHPLDGHGYLRAFTINGDSGQVRFSARYVKTEAETEEHDRATGTWRFTHRGPFSVLKGGKIFGNLKVMKNVANTSVVEWGGRLFCLWEGGDPYELKPENLDTIGAVGLINDHDHLNSGSLDRRSRRYHLGIDFLGRMLRPFLQGVFNMPAKRVLSHYKIDSARGRLIVLSCNAEDMLLPCSHFTFHEFDRDFKLLKKQVFEVSEHLMIHDWAFTDNYYVVVGNRVKLDFPGSALALSGLAPMIAALSVNSSRATSPVYLFPRFTENLDGNIRSRRIDIEAPSKMWFLHVANAFERRDEEGNVEIEIQATSCSYNWFNFHKMFGYNWRNTNLDPSYMNVNEGEQPQLPRLVQISIKLEPNGKSEKCTVQTRNRWNRSSDFPAINPTYSGKKNRYLYVATVSSSRRFLSNFPFDTVAKIDTSNATVTTWSPGHRRFIGEPIFIAVGEEEDDGYLLIIEYAVSIPRCYFTILDAKKIGGDEAVVAKFEIPGNLYFPMGFHGFWAKKSGIYLRSSSNAGNC